MGLASRFRSFVVKKRIAVEANHSKERNERMKRKIKRMMRFRMMSERTMKLNVFYPALHA